MNEIITDDALRELKQHGSVSFPFEYYYDKIKEFDKQYIDWHWHYEFEFAYAEKGDIVCLADGCRILLPEGDGIFINSNILHRFESESESILPNFVFAPEFISPLSSTIYQKHIMPVVTANIPFIVFRKENTWQSSLLDRFQELKEACGGGGRQKELEVLVSVDKIWLELLDNIEISSYQAKLNMNEQKTEQRVQAMLKYIQDNYSKAITLEAISASVNISKSEALRCFRSMLNTTPVNYLIHYRLNMAAKALALGESKIAVIADSAGFDNVSYFCHIFKKVYGMTPGEYRKR